MTPEQRQQWRLDATCVLGAASHWPESALDDSTRIIELLRELTIAEHRAEENAAHALTIDQERMAAESRARDLETERNLLRTTLAETLAMLQELDAAWNKDGAK